MNESGKGLMNDESSKGWLVSLLRDWGIFVELTSSEVDLRVFSATVARGKINCALVSSRNRKAQGAHLEALKVQR
jgi:hypothetical protein